MAHVSPRPASTDAGARDAIVVRNSAIHGRGVFAKKPIPRRTLIIEYTGKRISDEEAAELYDIDHMEHAHTMLFGLGDGRVIDAMQRGGPAKYINHSCNPNCRSVIDDDDRIWIESLRAIAPGEELTYDYRIERQGRRSPGWKRRYACRCGARSCRGTMLAPA